MKADKSLQELANKAFEEARGENIRFWSIPEDDPEVKYWKEIWIKGYIAASQFKTPPVQKPEFEDDVWDEFLNDVYWKNLSREELKSKYTITKKALE